MAEQTCEQRLPDHLSGRLEAFANIIRRQEKAQETNDWRAADDAYDEQYQMPLSVEVVRVVKVLLSTGGPGDWFEVTVDPDGNSTRVEYHFQDSFDHASVTLEGDERDMAEAFLRPWIENLEEGL